MKQEISPKLISLIFTALVICFVIAFYIYAWEEPTTAPTGENVFLPVNVSSQDQTKTGGLQIDGVLNANGGLIIETRASDPGSPVTGQMWLIAP